MSIKLKDLYPEPVDFSKEDLYSTTVIARADEYRVEKTVDNWVHLIDDEGVVRVTMPSDIWYDLVSTTRIIEKLEEICLEDQGVRNLLTSRLNNF